MPIHPPHVLLIFVRNKQREGLTCPQIAALLRKRLRWDELEPETMDALARERYEAAREVLRELEQRG